MDRDRNPRAVQVWVVALTCKQHVHGVIREPYCGSQVHCTHTMHTLRRRTRTEAAAAKSREEELFPPSLNTGQEVIAVAGP